MRIAVALTGMLFVVASLWGQTGPAFQWIGKYGSGQDTVTGLKTDAVGNIYVVGSTRSARLPVQNAVQAASGGGVDVYVTKLDPGGNVVYSTYFGGRGDDSATAMAVDALGNVYVTGLTSSADFPTTAGALLTAAPQQPTPGWTFVFRLTAEGKVGYSTYFSSSASTPNAMAVDGAGSAYLTGFSSGGIPVTAGAYQTVCDCGLRSALFFSVLYTDGFVARLDTAGGRLIYATYTGTPGSIGMNNGTALGLGIDGSTYVGGWTGIQMLDPTGSRLLARGTPGIAPEAMAVGRDGSVYVAGAALAAQGGTNFRPTAGAAQGSPNLPPSLPSQYVQATQEAVVKMDGGLQNVLAATYFGGPYGNTPRAMALDAEGNVYLGGYTSPHGLPTVTPLVEAFGAPGTGFAAKLSADLTAVLFASYFGDAENFEVRGIAVGAGGSLVLTGAALTPPYLSPGPVGTVWVNSLTLAARPELRIDTAGNAASRLDDPISTGETVTVRGAGFTEDSRLLVDGVPAKTVAVWPTEITAVMPARLPDVAVTLQVEAGGKLSNSVLAAVAAASPGLFSSDHTGLGQGYILNEDGKLNSTANPAKPGERITIFATGVGPLSFDHGYAVTANPVNVYIHGFYARGVAAVQGPVEGFPGDVYQLTVNLADAAEIAAINPDLKDFKYPAQVGVALRIANGQSQNGLALAVAQ